MFRNLRSFQWYKPYLNQRRGAFYYINAQYTHKFNYGTDIHPGFILNFIIENSKDICNFIFLFLKDMVALKRAIGFCTPQDLWCLSTFATDAACELDVLWHDGHTLGMDGAQVGILEESD